MIELVVSISEMTSSIAILNHFYISRFTKERSLGIFKLFNSMGAIKYKTQKTIANAARSL